MYIVDCTTSLQFLFFFTVAADLVHLGGSASVQLSDQISLVGRQRQRWSIISRTNSFFCIHTDSLFSRRNEFFFFVNI